MKLKIRTPYNSRTFPKKYESVFSPSLTVPDQSLTMRQILERYHRGLPLTDVKTPIYEVNDDSPLDEWSGVNPATLDISEHQAIYDARMAELNNIKASLDKKRKDAKKLRKPAKDVPAPSAGDPQKDAGDNTQNPKS